jgi:two-component system, OmpR family, phosphate regulon sensor histidine kinase PhoR
LVYSRIFLKLYAGFVFVILFTTAIVSLMIARQMQQDSLIEIEKSLNSQASILRESIHPALLSGQLDGFQQRIIQMTGDVNTRVTVISKDGAVLADTNQNPANMDNHLSRPEIQQALDEGLGITSRYSKTLSKPMRYLALPISDSNTLLGYVRVALPLSLIDQRLNRLRNVVIVAALLTSIIALFLGFWITRNFTQPLRQMTNMAQGVTEGDYQQHLEIDSRDELGDLANALNKMASTLGKVEIIRRDFVANASHELKTPLTAIRGFTETMIDDVNMDELTRRNFLEKIRDQTLRLSEVASDLLSLSRIESNDSGSYRQVNLRKIIENCCAALQIASTEKKLILKVSNSDEKIIVSADENAISQLIDNLVNNAIKYTPHGGCISVSLSATEKQAIIEIEDNGIGIDQSEQQRIFERFYRVDKSHSQLSGGTGLGLSIVKHITVKHEGQVSVVSSLGSGSVFRVSLPLANS